MGDLRAGTGGTSATQPTGKRVARHSAEQVTDQPYVGRRVASTPGRRRAEPAPESVPESGSATPDATAPVPGRRALRIDVVPEPVTPEPVTPAPVLAAPVLAAPVLAELTRTEPLPVRPGVVAAPVVPPAVLDPTVVAPVVEAPTVVAPVVAAEPVVGEAVATEPAPRKVSSPGRRAARRRSSLPLPGAPLLIGVAVLAVSAGGALQAMGSDADAAATAHHLTPASALSGSGSAGSASLLGDRAPVVSRDSDRLQATADAQAKQRAQVLSGIASKAEEQSNKIELHAWVLPVAVGVYHLTARFGDYSSLWSNFHTGLDFAAPTGTPIMAVAGGEITETAYSGAYGNRTIERLPDGTELWYCHQNEFGTQVGATVRPGEVIGYVGSTGNVTGPHLHLEVHPGGGDAVDPYTALVAHGLYPGPPS